MANAEVTPAPATIAPIAVAQSKRKVLIFPREDACPGTTVAAAMDAFLIQNPRFLPRLKKSSPRKKTAPTPMYCHADATAKAKAKAMSIEF